MLLFYVLYLINTLCSHCTDWECSGHPGSLCPGAAAEDPAAQRAATAEEKTSCRGQERASPQCSQSERHHSEAGVYVSRLRHFSNSFVCLPFISRHTTVTVLKLWVCRLNIIDNKWLECHCNKVLLHKDLLDILLILSHCNHKFKCVSLRPKVGAKILHSIQNSSQI